MSKQTNWTYNGRIQKFQVNWHFRVSIQIMVSRLKILLHGKHTVQFADICVGLKIIVPAPMWGYMKIKENQRNKIKTSSQDKFDKINTNPTHWYKRGTVQNLHICYIFYFSLGREEKDCMKIVK